MIRKLFVVLMLLVLLPTVLSFDSDNDGVSDTNDPFPLDSARASITDGTDDFNSATISKVSELYDNFDKLKLVNGDRDRLDIATVGEDNSNIQSVLLTWNNPASNSPTSWSESLFSELRYDDYNIMDAALISPRNEVTVIYAKDGTSYKIKSRSQEKFHRRSRGKTHLSNSELDIGSTSQSDYTSEGCSLTNDPYCEWVEYYIKDINIVNLDSDTIPELVLITEPYKRSTPDDERIHTNYNYMLIFAGTGDNSMFEEVPTLYKIPKVIGDVTFLDKNSFIFIQDLPYPDLVKFNDFDYNDPPDWDILQAVDLSDDLEDVSKIITSYDTVKEIYDISSDYILGRDYYGNSILVYDHDISLVKKIEIDSSKSKDVEDAKFGLMNNDDVIDIVVAEECQSTYHKNLQIWYGDENEEFTKQPLTNEDLKCVKEIAIGDIDRDGDHDILFSNTFNFNSNLEYLNWLENPGTPAALAPTIDDADNDGVEDDIDICPNTPEEADVNSEGCPDTDGDGIYDNYDNCDTENSGTFDQYAGAYWSGEDYTSGSSGDPDGCIDDSDSDEVQENLDMCPDTDENEEVDNIGCGLINQQSEIVLSSNQKVGVPISGIIKNLGENINGALSYFNKEIKIIYWFNGIKENKEVINDGGTLICAESLEDPNTCSVYNGNRVAITINYSSTNNLVEEGLECSCRNPSTFDHDIPMKFKINPLGISTQTSITETFINTYTALENCDYTPPVEDTEEETNNEEDSGVAEENQSAMCKISAMIFYVDETDNYLENNSFSLFQSDTSDEELVAPTNEEGEESPFGVYSQSCEYGNTGERIEGSEWCCIQGYLAKEVGALTSLNPNEAACTQYENKIPNAVISTNVTNISIGDTITFDASSSRDSDGTIKEYIWTFGDGSPQETGVTVEHKFETACSQDICIITLNVKDNFNNIGEEIINLNMTGIIVSEDDKEDDKEEDDSETVAASDGDDGTGGGYDWGAPGGGEDEDDGTKGSAAGWLIILAILAIMGGIYFAFKKGLFNKKKEPEPSDLDSETFEAEEPVKEKKDTGKMSGFISDQQDKGLSNEEIRQKLLGKGLSDDEVDKHMNASRE